MPASANPKVPQEFWSSYIVEKLFKTNPHLKLAFDESKFVKGGAIVYIPQAGGKPNVVKNRPTLPAVAVQRGDTSVFYPLDTWSTDPTVISWEDANQISYAKQDSVLGDHTSTLAEVIGDELLFSWVRGFVPTVGGGSTVGYLPTNRIFPTTGVATAVNTVDGQTGNRKALTFKEVANLQAVFNKDNVPKEDRFCVIESNMLAQLLDSLTSNQMHAFEQTADLKNGVIGRLYGFTILERSSVLVYGSANTTPNVVGQATLANDNLGAFFWQKNSVAVSMGDTELFQDQGNPLYYGDVYSGLVKMGGRCRRADWKGVAVVVQVP
jgi:Phage capsid protein